MSSNSSVSLLFICFSFKIPTGDQTHPTRPNRRRTLTDLSWSALRKRGRIIWRKLLVRSSLGWLLALLIEPFNRLLRKLCSVAVAAAAVEEDESDRWRRGGWGVQIGVFYWRMDRWASRARLEMIMRKSNVCLRCIKKNQTETNKENERRDGKSKQYIY